ncbi:hypothetical protein ACJX0J_018722, partial [Zea mays]
EEEDIKKDVDDKVGALIGALKLFFFLRITLWHLNDYNFNYKKTKKGTPTSYKI